MISKEEFIEIINDVKHSTDYQHGLNNYFRKSGVDGYIFQPDCCGTVLRLLASIFKDEYEWIEYFVFELDFGKKFESGCVKDENGQDVDLSTIENLYNFLCKRINQ